MIDRLHILTGEYPPQPGGVSDYTGQIAAGLGAAGVDVHVWAPVERATAAAGVTVHESIGWSRRGLAALDRQLDAFAAPRRLLVQYTPNAWGARGLNFGFCRWVERRRAAGDRIALMVHEPYYPFRLADKPTRWLLAAGQRFMIRTLVRASSRVFVAIEAWQGLLERHHPARGAAFAWLPVQSNIPVAAAPDRLAALRRALPPHDKLIGVFCTFGPDLAAMLAQAIPAVRARRPNDRFLLLGRGGDRFAASLGLGDRAIAPGALDAGALSLHLQLCDLMLQPYPDGVSSRRTTVMAALDHARPTVSNAGRLSDGIWAAEQPVALAPRPDPAALAALAVELLADDPRRARLGEHGRAVYQSRFSLERTVSRILVAAP